MSTLHLGYGEGSTVGGGGGGATWWSSRRSQLPKHGSAQDGGMVATTVSIRLWGGFGGGGGSDGAGEVSRPCGGEEIEIEREGISDMWKRKRECGAMHGRGSVACFG